jgi:hypothetical protein
LYPGKADQRMFFFFLNTSADQLNSMNESFGHVLETGAIDLRPTDIETDFPQILS